MKPNQKQINFIDINGNENQVIVHSSESTNKSGAFISSNKEKIKNFIKDGKVPNGSNGVWL